MAGPVFYWLHTVLKAFNQKMTDCFPGVSEQILDSTSAQIVYTVPFTSVYAGNTGQKTNQKQTLLKLNTTQRKKTTQNTAK